MEDALAERILSMAIEYYEKKWPYGKPKAEVEFTLVSSAEELEEVEAKAKVFSHNIAAADKGRLKDVEQMGFLKRDPVEWTARWEEVIDSVEQQVAEQLAGEPMGMGYCFGYWSAKAAVLADQYGIQWRSPSAMNPRVMFDEPTHTIYSELCNALLLH